MKHSTSDADELYAEIGERIQQNRNNGRTTKITQKELGAAVGLTRTSITNIEKGRQKLPIHTLYEIAHALQVSVTKLLPSDLSREGEDIMTKIPADLPKETRLMIAAELGGTERKNLKEEESGY